MNLDKLDKHYQLVDKIILSKQDPVTGLLPASTAVNAHGDYTDAWVRDNVYCILAVWGLALAYRRIAPDHARSYLLSQSVVKLMRGLLTAMMRQSDRVEAFKHSLDPADSIHAKFGTQTGLAVVGDEEWGHLQLDAISLYLLMLTQMIASGLRIIYTIDEVNFIQNLVHYISRTYCTADYGIWERGNKSNHGIPEINCSSVGMAKAALESLSGFNLFGNISSPSAVIHVVPSDPARSRFTLAGLLPRESLSKETDAALLSIIGYPAYAVENEELLKRTREKIIHVLAGDYGCKRFLLDGHQSALEDESRLHYEPSELQKFRNIESEWPLFFCYLLLDALMRGNQAEAKIWREKLEPLFVEQNGVKLLPELYLVPADRIEAEKQQPGSQARIPNENLPLTWAQSLFMLADMIQQGLLRPSDIDPLRRRDRIGHLRSTPVLVPILAENDTVKKQLRDLGYNSETATEIDTFQIHHAAELSRVQTLLGKNEKLGLSGRPKLTTRTLTSSLLYELGGQSMVFLPYFFNPGEFYLSHDNELLVEQFRSSIRFIAECWDQPGQPLIAFLVRANMLSDKSREHLLALLSEIERGKCSGVEVNSGRLAQLATTATVERIDYLHDYSFDNQALGQNSDAPLEPDETNIQSVPMNAVDFLAMNEASNEQLIQRLQQHIHPITSAEILRVLVNRLGLEYGFDFRDQAVTLHKLCEDFYNIACRDHNWSLIRRMADLLGKVDTRVEDTLLEIIIRQKRLAVGRAYSEKATFSSPHSNESIIAVIRESGGKTPAESILMQEIVLHLGHLLKANQALFENMLTLRVWHFIQLIVAKSGREQQLSFAEAYEYLLTLAPHRLLAMLGDVLGSLNNQQESLQSQERLEASGIPSVKPHAQEEDDEQPANSPVWTEWRKKSGGLIRLSPQFYIDIWHLLSRCNGLVIGDKYNLGSRIGAEITHDSTPAEHSFALLVEGELNNIDSPAYRQLNIELIETLIFYLKENPQLTVSGDLTLDIIIGYAVKISWQLEHQGNYDEQREQAWEAFYQLSPKNMQRANVEAIWHLLTSQQAQQDILHRA
ncbi:MAG: glycoside hydrolase family 15 protein [Gammaproteobacteria bacterium]|nr:glycoside hydrolase family 15 protein [Gammaproteobacteria bacterium]